MKIQWPMLMVALVFLLPPPLLSSQLRRTVRSPRRNKQLRPLDLLRPWQNWVDFIRAALGGATLLGLAFINAPGAKATATKLVSLEGAILLVALVAQVFRFDFRTNRPEQKVMVIAPVCYLSGLALAFGGIFAGGFAVLVAWALGLAAKNPIYILPTMILAMVGGSYAFGLKSSMGGNFVNYVALSGGLLFFPLLISFASRKPLSFVGLSAYETSSMPASVKPA